MNTREVNSEVGICVVFCAGVAEGECLLVAERPVGFEGSTVDPVVEVGVHLDGEKEVVREGDLPPLTIT